MSRSLKGHAPEAPTPDGTDAAREAPAPGGGPAPEQDGADGTRVAGLEDGRTTDGRMSSQTGGGASPAREAGGTATGSVPDLATE